MNIRTDGITTKPTLLSDRGRDILQKITLGSVDELRQLKLTLNDIFEMDADKNSLIGHARSGGHQGILDEFYKVIVKAHLTDIPGVIDTQYRCKYGYTLLHWAVYCKQDIRIIDFLISLQFDINAKSDSEKTPLYMACQFYLIDIINLFVTRGAKLDINGPKETTLLHLAVSQGSENLTRLFLTNGVNALQVDSTGLTALELAIFKGQASLVSAMIEMGVSVTQPNISSKIKLMKLVENSGATADVMKGYLLSFDTDEILLYPEKLAAITGKDLIEKMIKNQRIRSKNSSDLDPLVRQTLTVDQSIVEKTDASKRLRDSREISPQVSPSINGGPVKPDTVPETQAFKRFK